MRLTKFSLIIIILAAPSVLAGDGDTSPESPDSEPDFGPEIPPDPPECEWQADSRYIYCGSHTIVLPPYDPLFYANWYASQHANCQDDTINATIPFVSPMSCNVTPVVQGAQTNGNDPEDEFKIYDGTPCPDNTCWFYQVGWAMTQGGNGPYYLKCDPGPDQATPGVISASVAVCVGHGTKDVFPESTPKYEQVDVPPGTCRNMHLVQEAYAEDLVTHYRWCNRAHLTFDVCNGKTPPGPPTYEITECE